MFHHAETLLPELVGGFVGYFIHAIHHHVFKSVFRFLPKKWQHK